MGHGGVLVDKNFQPRKTKLFSIHGPQNLLLPKYNVAKNASSSPALPNLWSLPVFEKLLCYD